MLGTIYSRMTFGTYMTVCMRVYTHELPPEGNTLCIDVTVWAPLTVMCVPFGLNLTYTPTMKIYLSHQFAIH